MMMAADGPVAKLTLKQKECLRLVAANFTSKEIALRLGISPYSVDQRLRFATRTLGVSTRYQAARMLQLAEAAGPVTPQPPPPQSATPQCFVYQPPHVEPDRQPANNQSSDAGRDQAPDQKAKVLRDAATLDWQPVKTGPSWDFGLVSGPRGFGEPLGWQTKLFLAVIIAVLSLIAFGAAIAGLEVLSRIN